MCRMYDSYGGTSQRLICKFREPTEEPAAVSLYDEAGSSPIVNRLSLFRTKEAPGSDAQTHLLPGASFGEEH